MKLDPKEWLDRSGIKRLLKALDAKQGTARFVGGEDKVLNMISIAGKDQVMLQVRIVEVQRNVVKQLGVDLNAVLGQLGQDQFSFGISPTYGVNGSLLGGITGGYKLDTTKQPQMIVPCAAGPSAVAEATVRTPPVRDARVQGTFNVRTKELSSSGYSDLDAGTMGWQFRPRCGEGACDVRWNDLEKGYGKLSAGSSGAQAIPPPGAPGGESGKPTGAEATR